jgi:hypothetical protein
MSLDEKDGAHPAPTEETGFELAPLPNARSLPVVHLPLQISAQGLGEYVTSNLSRLRTFFSTSGYDIELEGDQLRCIPRPYPAYTPEKKLFLEGVLQREFEVRVGKIKIEILPSAAIAEGTAQLREQLGAGAPIAGDSTE